MNSFGFSPGQMTRRQPLPGRKIQLNVFCLEQRRKRPTLLLPVSYFGSAALLKFFGSSVRTRERPVASKAVSDAISKECLRRQAGGQAGGWPGQLFSAGKKFDKTPRSR